MALIPTTDGAASLHPYWGLVPSQSFQSGASVDLNLHDYVGAITPDTITISVSGLPSGLSVSEGIISGDSSVYGSHTITATATNRFGSNDTTFEISVLPTWSGDETFNGVAGTSFSVDLGSLVDGDISIVSGDLPAGLSLSNGIVSGTPTTAESSNVVFRATHSGVSSDRRIRFVITAYVFFIAVSNNKLHFYNYTLRSRTASREINLPRSAGGYRGGYDDAGIALVLNNAIDEVHHVALSDGLHFDVLDFEILDSNNQRRAGAWEGICPAPHSGSGYLYLLNDSTDYAYHYNISGVAGLTSEDIDLESKTWKDIFNYNSKIYALNTTDYTLEVFNESTQAHIPSESISLGTGVWEGACEYNGNAFVIDRFGNVRVFRISDGQRMTSLEFSIGASDSYYGIFFYEE